MKVADFEISIMHVGGEYRFLENFYILKSAHKKQLRSASHCHIRPVARVYKKQQGALRRVDGFILGEGRGSELKSACGSFQVLIDCNIFEKCF